MTDSILTSLGMLLVAVYAVVAALLAGYGLHSLWLLGRFLRHRGRVAANRSLGPPLTFPARVAPGGVHAAPADLPAVLVQVPVYNERDVVARVVLAVGALDWPAHRLRLQLLDDGTDDSVAVGARAIADLQRRGLDARHVRREQRTGFKAGALALGLDLDLRHPDGPAAFVAIFDADFVPPPDFLCRAVPPLTAQPDLAFVQGRWEHLNADAGLLTRAQAIGTDGHFAIEQAARAWSGLTLNFNGTCGVWRRAAIEDAGGWSHDTLTEDLDLSYRAQLRGWRAAYDSDLAVPGELPPTIEAWRSQQFRWAKGSLQTARKLLPVVWRSSWPLVRKVAATAHLTHYLVHPLIMASLLLAPLAASLLARLPGAVLGAGLGLLLVGTMSPLALYVSALAVLGRPLRTAAALPALMALGTGIAVSNTRAAWEALRGVASPFVRTPKHGAGTGSYRSVPASGIPELLAACWGGIGLLAAWQGRTAWLPAILAVYVSGFAHHGAVLFFRRVRESLPARPAPWRAWWPLAPLGVFALGVASLLASRDTSWREEPRLFAFGGLALGAAYLGGLGIVRRRPLGGGALVWVLAVGVGLNAIGTGLWHSDDVNRYLVEGRQVLAGQNPYAIPPAAPDARSLVPEAIARGVNHAELTAIYPPLALAAHAGVAALSPTPAGFTLAAFAATLVGIVLVLALLLRMGRPAGLVLAAAWNPVLPLFAAGEAHNDVFLGVLLVAALLLLAHGRGVWSLVMVTAAVLVKPFAVATLPGVLNASTRRRWWLIPLLAALAYAPFATAGSGLFASLISFGGERHFHGALDPLVRMALAPMLPAGIVEAAVRIVLLFLLVAGVAWLWRRRGSSPVPTLTVRMLGVLLLCLPTLHPWYFIPVALLLPFARTWALPVWTAGAATYWLHGLVIQDSGIWTETPWVTFAAHLPAVALMAWEAFGPAREPREPGRLPWAVSSPLA